MGHVSGSSKRPCGAAYRHLQDLAVDVDLELVPGCRFRRGRDETPRSPGSHSSPILDQSPLAVNAVHDLKLGGIPRHGGVARRGMTSLPPGSRRP